MDNRDIINELSKRYKELQEEFKSVQDLVNDIDFVFDYTEEEQWLFYRMRSTMEEHCAALLRLIRFLKKQELEEQGIKDWTQYKKTDSTHIGVDVSDEGDHGVCCQVCGDEITTHHCGLATACPVGGGCATVQDPNEIQPAEVLRTKEDVEKKLGIHIHEGNVPKEQCGCLEMKPLLGMEVVGVGNGKCEGCPQDHYGAPCVKLELVGGTYLCLAPLPNSIVTE